MRSKRFRFKKRSLKTRLYGIISLILLVASLVLYFASGLVWPLQLMAVGSLVALLLGNRQDKLKNGYFYVDNNELVIKNSSSRRTIQMEHVNDASIVDPGAAMRFIEGKISESDNTLSSKKRLHLYKQFCTIEFGLGARWMNMFGMLDQNMNSKRNDLILIRLADGTDVLLSPVHAHDAVAYINKVLATTKAASVQKNLFDE